MPTRNSLDSVFTPVKKSWPNRFDSNYNLVLEAKLCVIREKRAVSYLSVSARIRVIGSQMKREYEKTLDDADRSANRIYHIYVPSESFA